MSDWKKGGELYLPNLADAEIKFGIPTYLLQRIAFQESSWREAVVNGPANPENCIGLMQLNLAFFPTAGGNWKQDVISAARYLVQLHAEHEDWQLAVASYDWGPGNVRKYLRGDAKLPPETSNYVTKVFTDVPIAGAIFKPPTQELNA